MNPEIIFHKIFTFFFSQIDLVSLKGNCFIYFELMFTSIFIYFVISSLFQVGHKILFLLMIDEKVRNISN